MSIATIIKFKSVNKSRRSAFKNGVSRASAVNEFEGNEGKSFIALNVYACEVSCRAGTIKCSRPALLSQT